MAFGRRGETITARGGGVRRLTMLLAVVLAAGLVGIGTTQAVTVSSPGFTAKATATISPTRLPAEDPAPVTLTVESTGTRPDLETLPDYPLRYVDLRLDRQITVDTEGLATCTASALKFVTPQTARRKCGPALVGSGRADVTLRPVIDEPATVETHFDLLFFNAKEHGRSVVLMYRSYARIPESAIAWPIGNGRTLHVEDTGSGDSRDLVSTFKFTLGKTWRYKGERHSFLNGSCSTRTLRTTITLELKSGNVSETRPQRCTRRG